MQEMMQMNLWIRVLNWFIESEPALNFNSFIFFAIKHYKTFCLKGYKTKKHCKTKSKNWLETLAKKMCYHIDLIVQI